MYHYEICIIMYHYVLLCFIMFYYVLCIMYYSMGQPSAMYLHENSIFINTQRTMSLININGEEMPILDKAKVPKCAKNWE